MSEEKTPLGVPSPSPRRRRSAEVARREILDAAQRRLDAGGPDAIRLQDIARDVGIAHPTILHHFGSREGLIRALDARAVHALSDDVSAMLRSKPAQDSGADLLERLSHTMDDLGLARLIAWWAMREPNARALDGIDPPALVQNISQIICSQIEGDKGHTPEREELVSFGVRLAVAAMFSEALIGDVMSPMHLEKRDAERARFRTWLAELLVEKIADPRNSKTPEG
jgi:AcrR family transcriptional regulator